VRAWSGGIATERALFAEEGRLSGAFGQKSMFVDTRRRNCDKITTGAAVIMSHATFGVADVLLLVGSGDRRRVDAAVRGCCWCPK
jgi:hypothetical protein